MHTVWSESCAVGIDEVDAQHRRFMDCVNTLAGAVHQEGREKHETVWHTLHGVAEYVESHFLYEEVLMDEMGYPGLGVHRKMHELFILRVNNHVRRFDAGEDVTSELLDALERWIYNHIKTEDAQYAKFISKLSAPARYIKPRDAPPSMWGRLLGKTR